MLKEVNKFLDHRKKKVLQAIVEEYVNTAEPVSSNLLTKKEDLNYKNILKFIKKHSII